MTPPPETKTAMDNNNEDEVAGVDWGDIFTRFYSCTNITKPILLEMSFPEVMAINRNIHRYKPWSFTFGSGDGETEQEDAPPRPVQEQTIAERMAFAARFNK